eukprot:gene21904-28946_t
MQKFGIWKELAALKCATKLVATANIYSANGFYSESQAVITGLKLMELAALKCATKLVATANIYSANGFYSESQAELAALKCATKLVAMANIYSANGFYSESQAELAALKCATKLVATANIYSANGFYSKSQAELAALKRATEPITAANIYSANGFYSEAAAVITGLKPNSEDEQTDCMAHLGKDLDAVKKMSAAVRALNTQDRRKAICLAHALLLEATLTVADPDTRQELLKLKYQQPGNETSEGKDEVNLYQTLVSQVDEAAEAFKTAGHTAGVLELAAAKSTVVGGPLACLAAPATSSSEADSKMHKLQVNQAWELVQTVRQMLLAMKAPSPVSATPAEVHLLHMLEQHYGLQAPSPVSATPAEVHLLHMLEQHYGLQAGDWDLQSSGHRAHGNHIWRKAYGSSHKPRTGSVVDNKVASWEGIVTGNKKADPTGETGT